MGWPAPGAPIRPRSGRQHRPVVVAPRLHDPLLDESSGSTAVNTHTICHDNSAFIGPLMPPSAGWRSGDLDRRRRRRTGTTEMAVKRGRAVRFVPGGCCSVDSGVWVGQLDPPVDQVGGVAVQVLTV